MTSLSYTQSEWSNHQHVLNYLEVADVIPHRIEGEAILIDHIYKCQKILDIGTGNGRAELNYKGEST